MQGRRTNWSSLFFGLVFLGVSGLLLTGQADLVTRLRWAGPILLIVIALCLIGWAVAERPRPFPGASSAMPPSSWGAGAGVPGTATSWGPAGGPGSWDLPPAREPGDRVEPDSPADAADPSDAADPGDAADLGDPPGPTG